MPEDRFTEQTHAWRERWNRMPSGQSAGLGPSRVSNVCDSPTSTDK